MPEIKPPVRLASDSGLPRPRRVVPCPLAELAALLVTPDEPAVGTDGAEAIAAVTASDGLAVTGVTHASDQVRPGDLFAALPGSRQHGSRHVPAAAAAGAVAVLTDPAGAAAAATAGLPALVVADPRAALGVVAARVYGDPSARLPVIGVTGTAGKTTVVYLLAAGLRAAGRRPGLLSTVETRLGELAVDSVRTTPEATDLHGLLAAAVEQQVDTVAMEVSSHALELGRVGGVRFAVGGWTNFGTDHLDFHRTEEAYFAAKARLLDGRCRTVILNADDPAVAALATATTVTFSAAGDPDATWYATDAAPDGFGQRFTAHGPHGPVPAGVAHPGQHSVANGLLAIAALVAVGVDPATAAAGVAACPGVPGRMEVVAGRDGGVLGVVDYAHKPDSVQAVLSALRPVAQRRGGRLVCVLGAGGERDTGKRPGMGAVAGRLADLVVVTDDNPRGEDPAAIRAEVRRGVESGARAPGRAGPPTVEVVELAGRRAAIAAAAAAARPVDVVAVLGKGHERGQEIAGEVHPFDDRTELAAALS